MDRSGRGLFKGSTGCPTEGWGKRKRVELVCGGCHTLSIVLQPLLLWTTQARPLIFHLVTPINLTARQRLSLSLILPTPTLILFLLFFCFYLIHYTYEDAKVTFKTCHYLNFFEIHRWNCLYPTTYQTITLIKWYTINYSQLI